MSQHPEAAADELFVGNTDANYQRIAELHALGVRSARLGRIAYCIDGHRLPSERYAPVLIKRLDADRYNDVMMTRTFGPYWRQAR